MKEKTNLKDRFVAYYRVSTEKQDLDMQRYMLNSYLPEGSICEEFCEIESGKHMSTNEQLNRAVEYCKKHKKILAVSMLDRLGRNTEHALRIHRELDGWLFACNIPNEVGTRMDKLMFTFYMAFAEREREIISLRTKQGLELARARGKSFAPKTVHSDRRKRIIYNKAKATKLLKRYNDKKYHVAKDFILKRVGEWCDREGKRARMYWSRNFDDIYQEIADELNSLNVPVPDYLRERDKWLSRQVYKIYRDETQKVGLRDQIEALKPNSERRAERADIGVHDEEQDLRKSG